MEKIIRTICYFSEKPGDDTINNVDKIASILEGKGYLIQTKRICSSSLEKLIELDKKYSKGTYLLCTGSLARELLQSKFSSLLSSNNISFNSDLTDKEITLEDVQILLRIIKEAPDKTFNFTYVFNNPPSVPYFPSGNYSVNGFSIGLQPTDLSAGCHSLGEWFGKMREVWNEINDLFKDNPEFLGIDSSIAPLVNEQGSFIGLIKRMGMDFSAAVTTDFFLKISKFIKEENPKPVGLCGLMFPCLEDDQLVAEYEKGNFSIERNVYLSLHSGLGVDTYPVGVNERPERILEILKLIQGLSNKYKKPLSCRFVSDGRAKIGEKTSFANQYLKDTIIRPL